MPTLYLLVGALIAAMNGEHDRSSIERLACPPFQWDERIGNPGADIGATYDFELHDDGWGTSLYACGGWRDLDGKNVEALARWNGHGWFPVGGGSSGYVFSLRSFDDGNGASLFVGGSFDFMGGVPTLNIARWDGAQFHPLSTGIDDPAIAMRVYDDGSGTGPALFVGGSFNSAGGVPCHGIAKWHNGQFHPLGLGLQGSNPWALCMTVWDPDGPGPARELLIVGGLFTGANNHQAQHVAAWDGTDFFNIAGGLNDRVDCLAVFDDDGAGPQLPKLYAGGFFTRNGTKAVARWDGQDWQTLGNGMKSFEFGTQVFAMSVFDEDGDGPNDPALFMTGAFELADGIPCESIARWDGEHFIPVAGGLDDPGFAMMAVPAIPKLGPALYVGGRFDFADGNNFSKSVARWGCPPCLADFNSDGFVTGDDFDGFVAAFEAGSLDADYDGNGFVTGDDFDAFVVDFQEGC